MKYQTQIGPLSILARPARGETLKIKTRIRGARFSAIVPASRFSGPNAYAAALDFIGVAIGSETLPAAALAAAAVSLIGGAK